MFGGDEIRLNSTESYNHYKDLLKSGVSSKTFNAGTAELLSNVLNVPNPVDLQSKDGDTLTLSQSSKKQLTQEDVFAMAQKFHAGVKNQPASQRPSVVNGIFAKYASESGKGINSGSSDQVPDTVKKFFNEHSLNDLRNMSLEQIPDDVKDFVKVQSSS